MIQQISPEVLRRFDPLAVGPLAQDRTYYYFFKRALDVTVAALALVILLPLLALIAVLIAIDSPGRSSMSEASRRSTLEPCRLLLLEAEYLTSTSFARWFSADPSVHQAYVTDFITGRAGTANPKGPHTS
jgi:hypothetical protein